MELYSTRELERFYLWWRSVDTRLNCDSIFLGQPLKRKLPFEVGDMHFLSGSRWAAVLSSGDMIYMCNLDSLDDTPILIIQSPFQSSRVKGNCPSLMAVDETRDSPLLYFCVTIFVECTAENWRDGEKDLRPSPSSFPHLNNFSSSNG